MAKPERVVSVCGNQRPVGHPRGSCAEKGSREVLMKFAELMDSQGLLGKTVLVQTTCVGPCFEGPLVSVQPDDTWYKQVSANDVEEIVKDHLIGGGPVERCRLKDDEWD
ncbi:MAG: (2Fe-2S) ferredoxin domain-containing protein [Thermodesulfobacteriota bacterium]